MAHFANPTDNIHKHGEGDIFAGTNAACAAIAQVSHSLNHNGIVAHYSQRDRPPRSDCLESQEIWSWANNNEMISDRV